MFIYIFHFFFSFVFCFWFYATSTLSETASGLCLHQGNNSNCNIKICFVDHFSFSFPLSSSPLLLLSSFVFASYSIRNSIYCSNPRCECFALNLLLFHSGWNVRYCLHSCMSIVSHFNVCVAVRFFFHQKIETKILFLAKKYEEKNAVVCFSYFYFVVSSFLIRNLFITLFSFSILLFVQLV